MTMGWDHSRLFLWPIDATTWIVLTPDGDENAERLADYSRVRVPLPPSRNVALCARTSMGLTHDRHPTMMCDLSGRLFNVPLVTMGERVRRRIVRKLPVWRAAPANPPTPPRDPTAHVGTSLLLREPRQHASRTVGSSCFCV